VLLLEAKLLPSNGYALKYSWYATNMVLVDLQHDCIIKGNTLEEIGCMNGEGHTRILDTIRQSSVHNAPNIWVQPQPTSAAHERYVEITSVGADLAALLNILHTAGLMYDERVEMTDPNRPALVHISGRPMVGGGHWHTFEDMNIPPIQVPPPLTPIEGE
jgi:hypothetical protein